MFKKYFQLKVFSPQRTQSLTEVIFQCAPRITTQIKFKMPRGEGKYLSLSSFWKEVSQIT